MLGGQGVLMMQEFSRTLCFTEMPLLTNRLFPGDRHILGDYAYH